MSNDADIRSYFLLSCHSVLSVYPIHMSLRKVSFFFMAFSRCDMHPVRLPYICHEGLPLRLKSHLSFPAAVRMSKTAPNTAANTAATYLHIESEVLLASQASILRLLFRQLRSRCSLDRCLPINQDFMVILLAMNTIDSRKRESLRPLMNILRSFQTISMGFNTSGRGAPIHLITVTDLTCVS